MNMQHLKSNIILGEYDLSTTSCFFYSYRNVSAGFLLAARQLCQLTVNKAITIAVIPASAKIHQLSSVLYAKFRSHSFMANQATGQAMIKATATQMTKFLFNNTITWEMPAPLAFLIPISLVRCVIE